MNIFKRVIGQTVTMWTAPYWSEMWANLITVDSRLLSSYLFSREKEWGIVMVPEQRVQVRATRFRVPDITVLLRRPATGITTEPPFLCIEILSPSDRIAEMQERIDGYIRFGCDTFG